MPSKQELMEESLATYIEATDKATVSKSTINGVPFEDYDKADFYEDLMKVYTQAVTNPDHHIDRYQTYIKNRRINPARDVHQWFEKKFDLKNIKEMLNASVLVLSTSAITRNFNEAISTGVLIGGRYCSVMGFPIVESKTDQDIVARINELMNKRGDNAIAIISLDSTRISFVLLKIGS